MKSSTQCCFSWLLVQLCVFLQEALDAYQGLFKLVIGRAIATAYIPCASGPESATWYNRNLLLEQKFLCELFVSHSCASYIWEGIESPMWLTAWQANAVETSDKHVTALCIVVMHMPYILFSMTQRLQCCLLCGSACTHDGILVNLHHRFQDMCGSSHVADAPACHGIGFREAVEQDGTLLHTWDTGNTDMFRVIDKATIYFVNSNDQIMRYGEFGNAL